MFCASTDFNKKIVLSFMLFIAIAICNLLEDDSYIVFNDLEQISHFTFELTKTIFFIQKTLLLVLFNIDSNILFHQFICSIFHEIHNNYFNLKFSYQSILKRIEYSTR